MVIAACTHKNCKKHGKDRKGNQRTRCRWPEWLAIAVPTLVTTVAVASPFFAAAELFGRPGDNAKTGVLVAIVEFWILWCFVLLLAPK